MGRAGAWAGLGMGQGSSRPHSLRLTLGVAAMLLVAMAYVMWNPVDGNAERLPVTPAPTAESDDGYFLKAYEDPAAEISSGAADWTTLLDIGVKLLLVVGLIYLTAWGLRMVMGHAKLGLARASHIAVLESTNLAPNKALYLVEVGGKVLLLGGTQTQLAVLTEFADAEVVRELRGEKDFARELESSAARLEGQVGKPEASGLVDDAAEPSRRDPAERWSKGHGQVSIQDRIRELRQISQRFSRQRHGVRGTGGS